jgi:hypothetical protein
VLRPAERAGKRVRVQTKARGKEKSR